MFEWLLSLAFTSRFLIDVLWEIFKPFAAICNNNKAITKQQLQSSSLAKTDSFSSYISELKKKKVYIFCFLR